MKLPQKNNLHQDGYLKQQRHWLLAEINDRFYLYANAREEFNRYLKYRDKMQAQDQPLNNNYTYDYLLRRNRERTQLIASLHLAKLYFSSQACAVMEAFSQWDKQHLADKVSDPQCPTMKDYVQWKRSLIQVLWDEINSHDSFQKAVTT